MKSSTDPPAGRRPHAQPPGRDVHHQQAAAEQADLAVESGVRAEAVRLGGLGRWAAYEAGDGDA